MLTFLFFTLFFHQIFAYYCPKYTDPSLGFITFDDLNKQFCYLYAYDQDIWDGARVKCGAGVEGTISGLISIHDAFTNAHIVGKDSRK